MTAPTLLLSVADSNLDQQLRSNPVLQQFKLLDVAANQHWIDTALAAGVELVLVQVDGFSEAELEQLEDSDLLADAEVIFISKGEPNPVIDKAMMKGVAFHLRLPVDMDFIQELLEEIHLDLQSADNESSEVLTSDLDQFGLLVGSSRPMGKLYRIVRKAAASAASVLIIGESGSGKELVARTLHLMSSRRDQAFLSINCGAISPELIESELFGHLKGAFTGASDDRSGLFEQADGGTLFLDEVTEMPVDQQVKLLRVLESGEYRKLGDDSLRHCDVRVLAATNREPSEAISEDLFREDLYFRLAQFPVRVPPLRKRGEDLEGLARHFLAHRNVEEGSSTELSEDAVGKILAYAWPGNVRELKHCIERAYILADQIITADHIVLDDVNATADQVDIPTNMSLDEVEKQVILKTLDENGGKKKETAQQLGISVKTLYNKLEKYGADQQADEAD